MGVSTIVLLYYSISQQTSYFLQIDKAGDKVLLSDSYLHYVDLIPINSLETKEEKLYYICSAIFGANSSYCSMVITYSRVWINRVRLPTLLVVS